jgi:hypothetical protein
LAWLIQGSVKWTVAFVKDNMQEAIVGSIRIQPGSAVFVVLHSPREKCWGMLDEISPAGVFLRGLDLNYFDDWLKSIVGDEPSVAASSLFYPMWRIERLSLDEPSYGMPSMAEQVELRTGIDFRELLNPGLNSGV